MKICQYVAPFLLAASLLFLSGCGNGPTPLTVDDSGGGEIDDLMEDMEVPPPE